MAEPDPASTFSAVEEPDEGEPATQPRLYLVAEGMRPAAGGARIDLGRTRTLTVGRGDARALGGAARDLELALPDPWLSTRHALIERQLDQWLVEDVGSKNGTFVNGAQVGKARLASGDLVVFGRSFFRFRTDHAGPGAAGLVGADGPAPGLATLLPPLAERFRRLAQVAAGGVDVLVGGETGTGKEAVARAVHALARRPGALVVVNCGSIPGELVESELFGHKRGAFTGAVDDRAGLVRAAHRGTLFLDEVGDLPLGAQAALLRVLQEREVVPVGETRPVPVELTVVAATHRDLEQAVAAGRFRRDLLMRLAGFRVELPALRARVEDFGVIVASILERHGAGEVSFSPRALTRLLGFAWPGNIRQLDKCLAAAALLAGGGEIHARHLDELVDAPAADALAPDEGLRRDELVRLLAEHHGNVAAVAREMGKARTQVHRWLRRYGIDVDRYR